ncbi:hypothetical protein T265_14939, partial [Opisthorchis viverrini]
SSSIDYLSNILITSLRCEHVRPFRRENLNASNVRWWSSGNTFASHCFPLVWIHMNNCARTGGRLFKTSHVKLKETEQYTSRKIPTVTDEMNARICKARAAFANLRHLWRQNGLSLNLKRLVYQATVFDNSCLRNIARVYWCRRIRNETVRKRVFGYAMGTFIEECVQHQKLLVARSPRMSHVWGSNPGTAIGYALLLSSNKSETRVQCFPLVWTHRNNYARTGTRPPFKREWSGYEQNIYPEKPQNYAHSLAAVQQSILDAWQGKRTKEQRPPWLYSGTRKMITISVLWPLTDATQSMTPSQNPILLARRVPIHPPNTHTTHDRTA